jgi:hypothetical protein
LVKAKEEVKKEKEIKKQQPVLVASVPRVRPTVAPLSLPVNKQTIVEKIRAKFGGSAPTAIAVAMCESGIRNEAEGHNTDGSTDYGVFQINSVHRAKVGGDLSKLHNVDINIQVAYQISGGGSNWNPWTTYKSGCYKKYL